MKFNVLIQIRLFAALKNKAMNISWKKKKSYIRNTEFVKTCDELLTGPVNENLKINDTI